MADILTVEEYKTARKIRGSDRDDQIRLGIEGAQDAVLRYTDRDFTTTPASATRRYTYDGSGIVEIDDCAVVTSVKLGSRTLTADRDYITGPVNGDVIYWLDFGWGGGVQPGSPAMGFTSNQDVLGIRQRFNFVEVTASFGWPAASIPPSVRQAAIWLVDEFVSDEQGTEGLQAQSISDFSQVYTGEDPRNEPAILPPRVRQLLDPFRRVVL